jgi:hypothetical protein
MADIIKRTWPLILAGSLAVTSPASGAGGWYLMDPPYRAGQNAPLVQWKHAQAFDSARECQEERERREGSARRALREAREENDRVQISHLIVFYEHSRCIASDDPRLRQTK